MDEKLYEPYHFFELQTNKIVQIQSAPHVVGTLYLRMIVSHKISEPRSSIRTLITVGDSVTVQVTN